MNLSTHAFERIYARRERIHLVVIMVSFVPLFGICIFLYVDPDFIDGWFKKLEYGLSACGALPFLMTTLNHYDFFAWIEKHGDDEEKPVKKLERDPKYRKKS